MALAVLIFSEDFLIVRQQQNCKIERSRQDSKNWRAHIKKDKLTYFYFSNPVLACKQDIHFVSLILRAFSTKSSVSTYRKQVSYLAKYITLVCWAMDFQTYFYQVD